MQVKEAKGTDLAEIISLIRKEFPYLSVKPEKVRARLESKKIVVFKAVEKGRLLGFIEAEFLSKEIARVNGLTVKEGARKNGVATTLLEKMLEFLERKGIARVMLLVKQDNEEAKSVYSKKGFRFVGLYQREIDGSVVEEMELDLREEKQEKPSYVS